MRNTIKLSLYSVLVIFLIGAYIFFKRVQDDYISISNFDECVRAGYQVLTTYPEQCKIPGKIFTNTIQIAATSTETEATSSPEKNMNPKNTSYDIEGQPVLLQKGEATIPTSASDSSKTLVKYFGNELRVDINGDGKEDAAFLLTTNSGGSGTFYYIVVALNKDGGYRGTNGVFLGDRIAPQTTEWRNNELVVNYADRKIDEPMTTKPSIGVSKFFKVVDDTLTEITK